MSCSVMALIGELLLRHQYNNSKTCTSASVKKQFHCKRNYFNVCMCPYEIVQVSGFYVTNTLCTTCQKKKIDEKTEKKEQKVYK